MNKLGKILLAASLAALAAGGCGRNGGEEPSLPGKPVHPVRMVVGKEIARSGVRALEHDSGPVWVPLDDWSECLGYRVVEQQDGQYLIGGTDAAYAVRTDDSRAYAGDTPVQLPDPPAVVEGRPYLSSASFEALTGMPVRWEPHQTQLIIAPPAVPAAGETDEPAGGAAVFGGMASRSPAAGEAKAQQLIAYAKQLQGTPYQFNAGPYAQTKAFDCSSFTRFVYGRFGIALPRASVQQARAGRTVAEDRMKPGDLVFFRTPDRDGSSKIVGHVGMYIGGNRFIHAWGGQGVVISDLNGDWRDRFLFAKRVL
jgi:cell wall-associated NlpC family hydrolase